jgi:hypothetical protein
MTESIERRLRHNPVEEDLDHDGTPMRSDAPEGERLDAAQEAADLNQDPDTVPNREPEPETPTAERVGPWDDEELAD